MSIAQIVYDNEKSFGYTDDDIHAKVIHYYPTYTSRYSKRRIQISRIWQVMDDCIRTGVSAKESTLPGRLGLRRRAPMLYRRLMRGFYPGVSSPAMPAIESGWEPQSIEGPAQPEALPPNDDSPTSDPRGPIFTRRNLPHVVGNFKHALMPMPPVRQASQAGGPTDATLGDLEEDYDTCS